MSDKGKKVTPDPFDQERYASRGNWPHIYASQCWRGWRAKQPKRNPVTIRRVKDET